MRIKNGRGRGGEFLPCSENESCVSIFEHMVYNRDMRFRQPLDDVFRTATRVKVLRLLARNPEMIFTGREIARNIGVASSNVSRALSGLEKIGVLHWVAKGRSLLYGLNTRHILCERLLRDLFKEELSNLNYVTDEIPLNWPRDMRSLICYGSVARDEEQVSSDVDLCFVTRGPSSRSRLVRRLEEAQAEFYLRTGNRFSPYVISAPTFAARYRRADPLIRRIASEGWVLRGDSIGELVK
ncbi:MAG: MarR family transcriptional regulator [Terriglobia bacterium]